MWSQPSGGEKAWVTAQDRGTKDMGVDVMALDAAFLGAEVESELVEVASEIAAFMGDLLSVLLGGFGAVE